MPDNEDFLASEGILGLDNVLSEVFTIVGDLSPHIIDKEWLSEVVFVVGVGHSLEVQGHGGTALNIANLVAASGSVAIGVEETGNAGAILGEERVGEIGLPFLIVVHDVISFRGEETAELLVGEEGIKNVYLINSGLGSLISDASTSDQGGGEEVDFPERSMREHHEGESAVCDQSASPHIV